MNQGFIAPCTEYYNCNPSALKLFSRDPRGVDFVECQDCGLVWRDTMTCNNERDYCEDYFRTKRYNQKIEHRTKKAMLFLSILEQFTAKGKILEVGPGMGEFMLAAKDRNWKVQGLDISSYVTAHLSEIGLEVQDGTLISQGLETESYDALAMRHVLEHYRDPFEALAQAYKLLRKGGALLTVVPNLEYPKALRQREKYKFFNYDHCGQEHFVYFSPETLENILVNAGFEPVQIGFPTRLKQRDSFSQFLNRFLRKHLPFTGYAQEIFSIAIKR